MYDVSVVIPNYNGIKYLEHCLEALEKQRDVAFETIIVDNCSQDGSASLAKEKFPQCCYLSLDQNYGFCRAVNEGIKKAAAPFVVLLNNDTEVEPEFLKNFLSAISDGEHSLERVRRCFSDFADKYGESYREEDREAEGMGCVFCFENDDFEPYVYCVESDEFGLTYHRFTREDYEELSR